MLTEGTLEMRFTGTNLAIIGYTLWIRKWIVGKKFWKGVLRGKFFCVFWKKTIQQRAGRHCTNAQTGVSTLI